MPPMTLADRIRELEQTVATQSGQQEAINKAVDFRMQEQRVILQQVYEFCRATEKTNAVLQEKVAKLEATRSKVGDRIWLIVSTVAGGTVGSLLTWLLTRNAR